MCGIVGIAGFMPVNQSIYDALSVLQHRGQDAAGIITIDAHNCFRLRKANGLVNDVFEARHMQRLQGNMGIGHVRYPTAGSSSASEAQPFYVNSPYGITLAHNGNLTNTDELEAFARARVGVGGEVPHKSSMDSTNDTSLVTTIMASYDEPLEDVAMELLPKLVGAFSLVFMNENTLFAARDPQGVRPLVLGRLHSGWVVASETAAIDIVGGTFVREIEPGEMIAIDAAGLRSRRFAPARPKGCIFEYEYVARPDTVIAGRRIHNVRVKVGKILAREAPADADLVIPVPESGVPAAIGYAAESGIPFGMGLVKNNYVGRTFIQPSQTLRNLGPAPEPNITIFWDPTLPEGYKEFCAAISIETSSLQYESDKQIRDKWGDDAAIACCVSPMRVGKQMQFFGARVNAAKSLLYAINGGRDEVTGKQITTGHTPIEGDGPLDFDEVWEKYELMLDWVIGTYVEALNIIHYCHDRYAYEAIEMALHDSDIVRTMGCGIAGLSIVADSLSAIKYATVTPVRDETGLVVDYITEGDFPFYGNDDDRADDIAATIVHTIMEKIKAIPMYRDAIPTQSVLTITSNVVYGKATGAFPSGHKAGTPFAPGANPENGTDSHGMVASMLSVGKLDYNDALDGISLTNTITPSGLGRTKDEQVVNLVGVLDAGFIMDNADAITQNA
ncbi:MAG TPA: amidophosphoribosyltransferase [Leclercia adecarboxylata]|nr:amidophosphoribosyltransferase [Leclercia adecarboxylata]